MATEREGNGEPGEGLDLAESIKQICAKNARADLSDDKQLLLFLQSWWSQLYNRPLKDPLLLSYTLADLLYEFYDRSERRVAEEERREATESAKEDAKDKEVNAWADAEEKKDEASQKHAVAPSPTPKPSDPTKDPDNVRWMEEQIRLAKAELGDDFGDDLEINFDDK